MEILPGATKSELEVAGILVGLPQSFLDRINLESYAKLERCCCDHVHWHCKKKRSPQSLLKKASTKRKEELTKQLSLLSQQKEVLQKGMEDFMKFKNLIDKFKLQSKNHEVTVCMEQKMKAAMQDYKQIEKNEMLLEEKEWELKERLELEEQHLQQKNPAALTNEEHDRSSLDLNFPPV